MKKNLLLLFSSAIYSFLSAQTYCGSSRYDTEMFSNVTVTSDVVYGSNLDLSGNTVTLKMDIYEPQGDTATKRPLIVFAHGGSFIGGSKTDPDQVTLCTRFAKRGYVAASIDYRIGIGFPINQCNAQKAVWRATQDMKAAIRFFRQDAAGVNVYKADPNYVFAGGMSAGAFMAVHLAYLDQSSEIPSCIDTNQLGGLEGNSGNPGYSSGVNAIINLAGAVGDTAWIQPSDEPMVSAQGNADNTVPYCANTIYVLGFPIMVVYGSGIMYVRNYNIGLENPLHTFYGQDHLSPVSPSTNMDTSIVLSSDFVYKQLGCTPTNTAVYTNWQTCVPGVGMDEIIFPAENVTLFPLPARDGITVSIKNAKGKNFSAELFDHTGKKIFVLSIQNTVFKVEKNDFPSGIYLLKLNSDTGEIYTGKIIFTE